MDIMNLNTEKAALVMFVGNERDYTIYDSEVAGCGNCAMCDEVPRDACTHHGAAHRAEFDYGGYYLAYATKQADGFVGIAVRNNDDELVFPRDAKDFKVIDDKYNLLLFEK